MCPEVRGKRTAPRPVPKLGQPRYPQAPAYGPWPGRKHQYLAAIGPLSNWVGREDLDFMHSWTVFFWAWWISWSPFVGLFIARVSRGRTVRELTACMLIIPTLVAAIWDERLRRDCGIAVR